MPCSYPIERQRQRWRGIDRGQVSHRRNDSRSKVKTGAAPSGCRGNRVQLKLSEELS